MYRVLVIGDLHSPFHSRRALLEIYDVIRRRKPQIVVQIGDLYDFFSWGRFPRTHNIYTPAQELKLGRKGAETLWHMVKQAAPKAERIQLFGNHDERPVKRALEKAPELEEWTKAGVKGLMTFPGVELVSDFKDVMVIDGVGYHHGYLSTPGAHARAALRSMVVGHSHYGCVIPVNLENKLIWELNVGYVGNRYSVPMSYTQQRRFSRWTLGYGWIDGDGPAFCPLNVRLKG